MQIFFSFLALVCLIKSLKLMESPLIKFRAQEKQIKYIDLYSDQSRLVIANMFTVVLYNYPQQEKINSKSFDSKITSIKLHPYDNRIFIGCQDKRIYILFGDDFRQLNPDEMNITGIVTAFLLFQSQYIMVVEGQNNLQPQIFIYNFKYQIKNKINTSLSASKVSSLQYCSNRVLLIAYNIEQNKSIIQIYNIQDNYSIIQIRENYLGKILDVKCSKIHNSFFVISDSNLLQIEQFYNENVELMSTIFLQNKPTKIIEVQGEILLITNQKLQQYRNNVNLLYLLNQFAYQGKLVVLQKTNNKIMIGSSNSDVYIYSIGNIQGQRNFIPTIIFSIIIVICFIMAVISCCHKIKSREPVGVGDIEMGQIGDAH